MFPQLTDYSKRLLDRLRNCCQAAMQLDLNRQLYDAIIGENIEAISTLIGKRARIDPSLISSTDLDDAAQTQFDEDKTKLLESFYALFSKTLGSYDAKNPLVDFAEQRMHWLHS